MGLLRLALRRLFAQRSLAATMVATFAFTGGVLVAAPIYAAGAEQAIVYGYVEHTPPLIRDLTATFTTPPSFDIAGADTKVRSLLGGMPVASVAFQERSSVFSVRSAAGSGRAAFIYRDGLIPGIALTDGAYPASPTDVLLPQSIASGLRVGPGDTLSVTYDVPVTVRVSGIYAAIPSATPLIVSATSAPADVSALPILTTKPGFDAVVGKAGQSSGLQIAWDAKPDVRGASLTGLTHIADQEHRTANAISEALSASVSSNLSTVIDGVRHDVTQSRAPIYLVVLQIAMVGLGMSIGVGSLKLRRQAFELSILKTRGARTGFLVGLQAAELLITGLIGWALSLGIGLVLATMARAAHGPGAPGAPFDLSVSGSAEFIGFAGIAVGAAVVLVLALPHIRRSVLAERREVSRERRPAWLRFPAEVLPLALGAVALAELRRRGIRSSGSDLDPLVLVAPTLLLLGGSLLAVRLFFWTYGRAERAADRTASPSAFLAIHRLSRSSADMALMVLLVLSIGLFSFSASLRSTVLTHNTNAARADVGADWRFLVPPPADEPRAVAALPGETTLAFKGPVNTADDPRFAFATVVGVDPRTYPDGGWWRPGDSVDPLPDLLGRLDPAPIGFAIGPGVSSLEIEATTPDPAPAGVHMWVPLVSRDGSVKDADLGPLVAGTQTYRTATGGAVRGLSVMLAAPAQAPASLVRTGHFSVTFEKLSLLGTGSNVTGSLDGWGGLQATGLIVSTDAAPSGGLEATFQVAGGGPIGGIAPSDAPLPAIVRVGSAGGSPVGLRVGSVGITIHPVGTLSAFPTIGRGSAPVIVPIDGLLERFQQILRPPNGGVFEVLGMGTGDPTADVRRAGFEVGLVSRAADIEASLATSPQNLALGMEFASGVAGVVLAVMSLSLALFFGAQRRRYELSSLRALGGRASHAMIALAGEYGLVLVPAFIVGAVVGTVLLDVVLAYVAPSVAGTGLAALVIDRGGVAIAAGAALTTLALGLLSAGKQMRASSPSAELRGEPE